MSHWAAGHTAEGAPISIFWVVDFASRIHVVELRDQERNSEVDGKSKKDTTAANDEVIWRIKMMRPSRVE